MLQGFCSNFGAGYMEPGTQVVSVSVAQDVAKVRDELIKMIYRAEMNVNERISSMLEADYVPRKLFTANHKSMFEKHTKVNAKIDAALEKIDKRVKYLEEVVAAQKRAM